MLKFTSFIKIVLPLCLLIAGYFGFSYLKTSKIKIQKKAFKKTAITVETIKIRPADHKRIINAMGTVLPERKTILKSKVQGEVVFVSSEFVKGGLMQKKQSLLLIDDSDYKIEMEKAKSALEIAAANLAIEQGSQTIAKKELEIINKASLNRIQSTNLSLRKPQLAQAKAVLNNAKTDLKKTKLNLLRTKIIIPFNCLILEKYVSLGSIVTSQEPLAQIVDTSVYQIEAFIQPNKLSFLTIDKKLGSKAIVFSQYSNEKWEGKLVRITGKISDETRMAGIIILINNPLEFNKQKSQLLLNDHVDIKIIGKPLINVFAIPRSIVRDNNTLWIYKDGRLLIKKIKPIWKDENLIYVKSDLSKKDMLITSNLSVAINKMKLQLVKNNSYEK